MSAAWARSLARLLAKNGVAAPEESMEKLAAYHALLLQWNARMDLTSVPEKDIPLRHYADSLLPLARDDWFAPGARVIDVGTGAGFPGLMLAMFRPDMPVTLLDSRQKRCEFLAAAKDALALDNAAVIAARAEVYAQGTARESFDIACARAVAPLNILCEYLLPFVRVGGLALCWKGPSLREEAAAGAAACALLGARMGECHRLPIPDREHLIQPLRKTAATVRQYPRPHGKISREPLGFAPNPPQSPR